MFKANRFSSVLIAVCTLLCTEAALARQPHSILAKGPDVGDLNIGSPESAYDRVGYGAPTIHDLDTWIMGQFNHASECINNLNLLGHGDATLSQPIPNFLGGRMAIAPDMDNSWLGAAYVENPDELRPSANTWAFWQDLGAKDANGERAFCGPSEGGCTIWMTHCAGAYGASGSRYLKWVAETTGCQACGYDSLVVFGGVGSSKCETP